MDRITRIFGIKKESRTRIIRRLVSLLEADKPPADSSASGGLRPGEMVLAQFHWVNRLAGLEKNTKSLKLDFGPSFYGTICTKSNINRFVTLFRIMRIFSRI